MSRKNVFIIIACYNEGPGITSLLRETENLVSGLEENFTVVVVDDGSEEDTCNLLAGFNFSDRRITFNLLQLEYNTGHQSAIAQGIHYSHTCSADYAIIMDGDGEDNPSAIPELLRLKDHDIVNVIRGKRGEGAGFMLAYGIYRMIFKFVTGKKMNFGNYCMINARVISIINSRSFIHLAAFLSKLKLKSAAIRFDKRQRLSGKSKMTVADLVHHAFRSFVEYAGELVMLFLKLFLVLFVLFILLMGYILYLKLFTNKAILGWSSTLGIGLLTSAILCIGFFITGMLLLNLSHSGKNNPAVPIYKLIR